VLPLDQQAAAVYADLFAPSADGLDGRSQSARSQGASVVTRDVIGFAGCGLNLINP
jgi:hypothetical protein